MSDKERKEDIDDIDEVIDEELGKARHLIIQVTQEYLTTAIFYNPGDDTFDVAVIDKRTGEVMSKTLTAREFVERVTYLGPKYMLYEMDRRLDGDEELYEFWEGK